MKVFNSNDKPLCGSPTWLVCVPIRCNYAVQHVIRCYCPEGYSIPPWYWKAKLVTLAKGAESPCYGPASAVLDVSSTTKLHPFFTFCAAYRYKLVLNINKNCIFTESSHTWSLKFEMFSQKNYCKFSKKNL